MKKFLLFLTIFALFFATAMAQEFYPTTVADLNATVRIFGTGNTISGLATGESATFQAMTFQESQFQDVNVISETLYINGKILKPGYVEDRFGNKYVKFMITENGDFNYEIIAKVHSYARLLSLNDYNLSKVPTEVKEFLLPSEKIESASIPILTLAENKLPQQSFISTLTNTIAWVNDYVDYASGSDFQKYYELQQSAVQTLIDRKGVCDEFANLAASLLRAKGIPTRIAIGVTFDGSKWGNHAWIEVYHKDYGWIPSDPTFRETGFVDATHLRMGSFSDVTESKAKCFYPEGANCKIVNQPSTEVTIESKTYFSNVSIAPLEAAQLNALSWNTLPITITNLTNSKITVPVKMLENYKELLIQDSKKGIILGPSESAQVTFRVYPDINLGPNEFAEGNITFNTLNGPYTQQFKIGAANQSYDGDVIVQDITPIADGKNLKIAIKVTNYYPIPKDIAIDISPSLGINSTETLAPFETKIIGKVITPYEETPYKITITTPKTKVSTTLFAETAKDITVEEIPDAPGTITVVSDNNVPGPQQPLLSPELIVIIAIILIGLVAFAYFLRKPRYV